MAKRSKKEENFNLGKIKERRWKMKNNGSWGAIYGMAFLGALVYYIQHAGSFTLGVIGVFKAIFWPGVLLYKVLEILKM